MAKFRGTEPALVSTSYHEKRLRETPYGTSCAGLTRTHARTHTTRCKALTKPKNACRGCTFHTNHQDRDFGHHRTRPTTPARAAAAYGLSTTAGVHAATSHDTCTTALQAPHCASLDEGISIIARTRACARPPSRSGSVVDRSVFGSKKRSGGSSVEVGER